MANLRVAALNGAAATVEVRQLTLLLGGDELCGERQADGLPTLGQVDEAVGCTLIPHTLVVSKRVADRTVEVALIHQQMVAGRLEVALYQVSVNGGSRSRRNTAISVVYRIRGIVGINEIGCQYLMCLLVDFSRRRIDQQVRRLTLVDDIQQTVCVVEQRRIEHLCSSG